MDLESYTYLRHISAVCTGKALVTSNKDSPWEIRGFYIRVLRYHTEPPLVCTAGLPQFKKGNHIQRSTHTTASTQRNTHRQTQKDIPGRKKAKPKAVLAGLPPCAWEAQRPTASSESR